MLINAKPFNFSFFLNNRRKVNSLEAGARLFGGATQFDDAIYSNFSDGEFIQVNSENNSISIFVPSTMSIDQQVTDNSYFVSYSYTYLKSLYQNKNIKYYDTMGSWYSEELQKVVIENITIITVELQAITESDIQNFIELASWIKKEMKQECVSIAINNALAII